MQTTIICKHTTTYVDTPTILHAQIPTHCTCCPSPKHPKLVRESNIIDAFALKYNVPPILAATLFTQTQKHNTDILNHNRPRITLEDYATMIGMSPVSTGITPLYMHCMECGSTFTVLRSDPNTYKTPPAHCIYCASTRIGLQQADPEQTAFIVLAHHYALTVPQVRKLFDIWAHQPKYATFALFMASDTMATIRPLLDSITPLM